MQTRKSLVAFSLILPSSRVACDIREMQAAYAKGWLQFDWRRRRCSLASRSLERLRMKMAGRKNDIEPDALVAAGFGVGSWIILMVLVVLLVGTTVIAYQGWTLGNGTDVPASGYVAMAFGILVSLGVGFGLMALIFYSSRKGYDDPPVLISSNGDDNETGVSERKK